MEISCGISSFISLKLLYIYSEELKESKTVLILAFKFLSKYKKEIIEIVDNNKNIILYFFIDINKNKTYQNKNYCIDKS